MLLPICCRTESKSDFVHSHIAYNGTVVILFYIFYYYYFYYDDVIIINNNITIILNI